MSYPRTIRNFNAFVDGISYFGKVSEGKLPDLKIKTAAHRGAGMDGELAIDMGMEALQSSLTFDEWNPAVVKQLGKRTRFVLRPAAMGEDDFVADAWIFTCGGRVTTNEFDALKPGDPSKLKAMLEVDFFRAELNGEELFKIDIENGVRIIGGEDQLASMRSAMGL